MDDPTNPEIVEPTPAPEVFVDGYQSSTAGSGVAKFVFFSLRHNAKTGEMERHVVLHLVMPLVTLMGVHEANGNLIEQLRRASPNGEEESHGHN